MHLLLVSAGLPEGTMACLRTSAYAPLAPVHLATFARKCVPDLQIVIIDDQIGQELPKNLARFDLIGISANTLTYPRAIQLARVVRAEAPEARIVLGGIHATILAPQILEQRPEFDCVVLGQGEAAITALLRGAPLEDVPNLAWLRDGSVRFSEVLTTPINRLPIPDYTLIETDPYFSAFPAAYSRKAGRKGIAMQSSTGCVWRRRHGGCSFCSIPDSLPSRLSPGRFWEVVAQIHETTGADFVWDVSDTFSTSPRWIRALAQARPDVPVGFHVYVRAEDVVEGGIVHDLRRVGVEEVLIGVESFDEHVLSVAGKGSTPSKNILALHALTAGGISAAVSIVLGLEGETPQSLDRTVEACRSLKARVDVSEVHVSVLTPLPGTSLFQKIANTPTASALGDWGNGLPLERLLETHLQSLTQCTLPQVAQAFAEIDGLFPSAGPFFLETGSPLADGLAYTGSI